LSGGGIIDLWGHNGGEDGVSTDIYINPDNNIGIVVLSNGEGDNLYVVDELYDYALSLSTSGVGNPHCNATTAINENYFKDRTLTKIVSVLGREIAASYNTPLFYIYDDGTVEKRIIIE
jgi:CubicO group peptidase (beta-lactamase class C family)